MSGFYIGVDGKARKVKGGYIGIDGKARKIKKGYIGDANGVARLCYSLGTKLSEYPVGSTVYLNENGTPVEYLVVNQGLPSDSYDSSCDGVWLLRKGLYGDEPWDSGNSCVYADSTIHSWLNDSFLKLFDVKIQNTIKNVKIPYINGNGYTKTTTYGADGLSTQIFLLSPTEINVSKEPAVGSVLDYFVDVGLGDSKHKVYYSNGSTGYWWTRVPTSNSTTYSYCVSSMGNTADRTCSTSFGIRPALILPNSTLVEFETNEIIG